MVATIVQDILSSIKIEPKLKNLLPPLTVHEFKSLEENISKYGVKHPLLVWRKENILVDGHNRYEICKGRGIKPQIEYMDFETVNEAMLWIIEFQDTARQLNAFQRCELRLKHKQLYLEKATKNSNLALRGIKVPEDQKIDTNAILAGKAGVQPYYFVQVSKIVECGDPLLRENCRTGLVPVAKAYKMILSKEKEIRPKSDMETISAQLPVEHTEILRRRMKVAKARTLSEMVRIAVKYYLENAKGGMS